MKRAIGTVAALVLLQSSLCVPAETPVSQANPLTVGLRRSNYGLESKNADDAWWVDRAKGFASSFPGSRPAIIEIVSTYLDDGSTEFGFEKPAAYTGPTDRMAFVPSALDHERALRAYDAAGVEAIIQFEPGDADVIRCLELAHIAFGKHSCVIGYGIDAEWFCTKQSPDMTGLPVTDEQARAWVKKVESLNKDFTFFIKHFDPKHLPPSYRAPSLWFLSDSQQFDGSADWLKDMKDWARAGGIAVTGYQFGYPDDEKWWSKLKDPPIDLGMLVRKNIARCDYLFWVDFTANRVQFGTSAAAEGAKRP